jgi:hypothetical protein
METKSIVRYKASSQQSLMEGLQDYINRRNMKYDFDDLSEAGFLREADMHKAMQDAIHWLELSGQDSNKYFYSCLIGTSKDGSVYRYWKMSRAGLIATIIHAPELNPKLAKIRWNLLNNLFSEV